MRRSTTSAATDRRRLAALLIAELICALLLVGRSDPRPPEPAIAAPASLATPTPTSTTQTLADGRTVHLIGLGGQQTAPLLARIAAHTNDAAKAVTSFWGPGWPRDIVVVASGSNEQFDVLAGGRADIAATTTAERIMFAPGAAAMSDAALRMVLGHELFHYAARAETAPDAPRWLTEGVADFVGRPQTPRPVNAAHLARIPTDAELNAQGAAGSEAYDSAWWFSRYVADRYGTASLRSLYVAACGQGHPDLETAVQETLHTDLGTVLAGWQQWLTG
jgi:hypothetical protein